MAWFVSCRFNLFHANLMCTQTHIEVFHGAMVLPRFIEVECDITQFCHLIAYLNDRS